MYLNLISQILSTKTVFVNEKNSSKKVFFEILDKNFPYKYIPS